MTTASDGARDRATSGALPRGGATLRVALVVLFACAQSCSPVERSIGVDAGETGPTDAGSTSDTSADATDLDAADLDAEPAIEGGAFTDAGDGACCAVDGGCTAATEDACRATAGFHSWRSGESCDVVRCPDERRGACCRPDRSCDEDVTADLCMLDGFHAGPGSTCATAICPGP